MADTHVRIDSSKHKKMQDIVARKGNTTLKDEYDKAIEQYIKQEKNAEILLDTQLENFINEKFQKFDSHISSMLGRTGMDVSMVFMGVILLIESLSKGKYSREELMEQLRRQGAVYFSTAIKKDKEFKKNNFKDEKEL